MKLPQAEQAVVDIRKVRGYCLDPDHPRGRHKARVFKAALGITRQDAEFLRQRLLEAVRTNEAVPLNEDLYGVRYQLDFEMEGPAGSASIRSLWIVRRGETFPRLVSCFIR